MNQRPIATKQSDRYILMAEALLVVAMGLMVAGFVAPPEDLWIFGSALLLVNGILGVCLVIQGHRRMPHKDKR